MIGGSLDDQYVSREVAAVIDQRISEADAHQGDYMTLDDDEREVRSRRHVM